MYVLAARDRGDDRSLWRVRCSEPDDAGLYAAAIAATDEIDRSGRRHRSRVLVGCGRSLGERLRNDLALRRNVVARDLVLAHVALEPAVRPDDEVPIDLPRVEILPPQA